MDKKAVQKIKELADFIVLDRDDNEVKKAFTKLNGMKVSQDLRQYLLKLIEENIRKGNSKPLLTIEDYVDYLFPDGGNWKEIRDLVLIAGYQKLHETNRKVETDLIDIIEEPLNDIN